MSKEEIIKKHLPDDDSYRYDNVYSAMQEYADQQLSEARKRIEDLENGLKEIAKGQQGELKGGFIVRAMNIAKSLTP